MTYDQISQYINTVFIYGDVTDEEYHLIQVTHYMVVLGTTRYVGTNVEVEALTPKKLEPAVIEEVQDSEVPAQE